MSIASEISRLSGVREDIFTSITNKGVTVPATATFSSCPALIDSITGGGGSTIDKNFPFNPEFFTDGIRTTTFNFTATQVPSYESVPSSTTTSLIFNDGSWDHGGDIGIKISESDEVSAFFLDFKTGQLSGSFTTTSYQEPWMDREDNIRYSYDSASIPDNNFCGRWKRLRDTNVVNFTISGFGSNSGSPTGFPIYLSFPYTNRDWEPQNPIEINGFSAGNATLPYPQYDSTSTGVCTITASAGQYFHNNTILHSAYREIISEFPMDVTSTMTYADGPDKTQTAHYTSSVYWNNVYDAMGLIINHSWTRSRTENTGLYYNIAFDTNYGYTIDNVTTSYSGVNIW